MMLMTVSDADIVRRLTSVLKTADLATTTTTAIRQHLEHELGVDLSDKKVFIRQQVDLYLQQQEQEDKEKEEEEEAQGEEEEEEQQEEQEQEQQQQDEVDDYGKQTATTRSDSKQRLVAKIGHNASKESSPKEKKKRTGGSGGAGGLNKLCSLSPELQAVVGETELPRTQVVKLLWAYIRENGLQDPENRRKIICNDVLRILFNTDSTDMFKMNKLLSKHIWPLENGSTVVTCADNAEPRPKKPKIEKSEAGDGGRGRSSGFLAPIPISEGLAKFLGAEDGKVSCADAVKRIWDYIKENNLQDPTNKKMIVCDTKLQELFECDTFVGFGLTKLLSPHFLKA
ncbi:unnamed protein product [Sphagnum jensenii]|uniref:Uncharacterized protein n=1 Tax=Sphagnum jensenii TaxID=128206 RepID=A0ABP1BBN0_9BRYO